jgi:HK97 family phage portal protein
MSLLYELNQTKAATFAPGPTNSLPQLQFVGGRLVSITDNQESYIRHGYSINDIIYSIITLIMDKIKVAPWAVYTVKDEGALKAYFGMQKNKDWAMQDAVRARDLRHKALQIDKNPGKLGELVKYANEYETFPEFVGNGCGYKLLTGNKYIWADILEGGANKGTPQSLWNLPSQWVQIKATDSFPTKILSYLVSIWRDREFMADEVLHEKYWNPSFDINGQQLYGVAPLRAALKILNRDNSSLEASASAFQNEGIKGILHMKADPLSGAGESISEEVRRLKKQLVTEWVGESNRGKMGISGYDMGWLPIGLTSQEMQQIENEKWNMRRLCSVWGVSSRLLNDPDNTAEANVEEAEKSLTTRCALPALTATRDNFNRKIQQNWGGVNKGKIIDFDMTCYGEIQDDNKDTVDWMERMKFLSPNERRAMINLETLPDKIFDQVWVTQDMGTPLSEWQMNDVDETLIDES